MTVTDDSVDLVGLLKLPTAPTTAPVLLPLDAGEQYRFGFAMDACIGCHACEVACAEQNGNPVDVLWRQVGELEGGSFPSTRRFHLSMACNHCLDPACLVGCPTNAYVKLDNGVVKHNAEDCVGCQYCIWNCPYEVPIFNPDRRVVTKCDMCLPRLEAGQLPACVVACPTQAITIEKVDTAQWRADHTAADAPGLPSSQITLSTTRVQMPATMPVDTGVVRDRVRLADPHWPLVILTLLSQLAVGTVAAGIHSGSAVVTTTGFVAAAAGLAASLFHLGRPAAAWKAVRNLRRSWLSREVVLLGAFTALAALAAATRVSGHPVPAIDAVAVVCGVAGVYASGRLYLVPARPAWNSPRTVVAFFATAAATGPLAASLAAGRTAPGLRLAAGAGLVLQLAVVAHLVMVAATRTDREHRGTAWLLLGPMRRLLVVRVIAAAAAIGLLVRADSLAALASVFVLMAAGELIGRYLFYVTVVPMTTAGRS